MALDKVVIAGGSGFIGTRLTNKLVSQGTSVKILTRSASTASKLPPKAEAVLWSPSSPQARPGWESALANADLVVNLAGTPVVSRWTEAGKREIIESRVKSTRALVDAIGRMDAESRPKCLCSASAVGYYGTRNSSELDENGAKGNDFLSEVCEKWEEEAVKAMTRVVIVRIGVVLGAEGGGLARMIPVFKVFLGGSVGSGRQIVSWIHVDDLVRIFIRAGESEMRGVYNGTAPVPVSMGELARELGKAMGRPSLFPVPALALKLLYGEGSMVVLEGQKVLPKKLLSEGFGFGFRDVGGALRAVVKES